VYYTRLASASGICSILALDTCPIFPTPSLPSQVDLGYSQGQLMRINAPEIAQYGHGQPSLRKANQLRPKADEPTAVADHSQSSVFVDAEAERVIEFRAVVQPTWRKHLLNQFLAIFAQPVAVEILIP
jgi:hypothetical protein